MAAGRSARGAAAGLAVLLGAGLLAWGYLGLQAARSGLVARDTSVSGVPLTIWTPPQPRGPVVVVVHGLAGSRQVMQPYALALAHAGFTTIALDLPGHGGNRNPLSSTTAGPARDAAVDAAVDAVVAQARRVGDGRVGLIGHSLGADAVIRYAARHPGIVSVVALAPGTDVSVAGRRPPTDLLVLAGGLDSASRPVAERIAVQLGRGDKRTGVSHGTPGSGTAWRVEIVPGVEHVGILFSGRALGRSRSWLAAGLTPARAVATVPGSTRIFGGASPPGGTAPEGSTGLSADAPDPTLPRLLAVYAGGGALLLLLLARLPVRRRTAGPCLGGGAPAPEASLGGTAGPGRLLGDPRWWLAAVLPAIAGAVAAAVLPAERYLPIAVAGRLAVLFTVQGLGTLLVLRLPWWRAGRWTGDPRGGPDPVGALTAAAQLSAVLAGVVLAVGWPTQRYLLAVLPTGVRWWSLLGCAAAALPAMAADAALTRHPLAPRAAPAVTTGAVLAAWLLAMVLNPLRLGFLVVVGPLLAAFLVVFAVLAAVAGHRTGGPAVPVVLRALTLGWILSVTFPLLG